MDTLKDNMEKGEIKKESEQKVLVEKNMSNWKKIININKKNNCKNQDTDIKHDVEKKERRLK